MQQYNNIGHQNQRTVQEPKSVFSSSIFLATQRQISPLNTLSPPPTTLPLMPSTPPHLPINYIPCMSNILLPLKAVLLSKL